MTGEKGGKKTAGERGTDEAKEEGRARENDHKGKS